MLEMFIWTGLALAFMTYVSLYGCVSQLKEKDTDSYTH